MLLTDLTGPKHSQSLLYQLGDSYCLTIMDNYNRWTFVLVLRGTKLIVISWILSWELETVWNPNLWAARNEGWMEVWEWMVFFLNRLAATKWLYSWNILQPVYIEYSMSYASLCIIPFWVTSLVRRFGCYFASFSSKVTQLMDMPSRPGQRYVVAAPRIPWSTFVVSFVIDFVCLLVSKIQVAFASAFGTFD